MRCAPGALAGCLSLALCGCGGDDDGADDGDVATACANVHEHCPTGYSWSAFVSDEESCTAAFACVRNFYEGGCQATLEAGTDCLADLTGPERCGACDAIMTSVTRECPFPAGCFGP